MPKDIITIKQLPIIEQRLSEMSISIQKDIANLLSMEVTEENRITIKKQRATINSDFLELEEKRKQVKNEIIKPYNAFEKIYKEKVTNIFSVGLKKVDEKVNVIESGLIKEKQDEGLAYFNELVKSKGIDFLKISDTGVRFNLTNTVTKLKKQILEYVESVSNDIELIAVQENQAEVFAEYKKSLDVNQAILEVTERNKRINEEKERLAERKRVLEQQRIERQEALEKAKKEVVEIAPPATIAPPVTIVPPATQPAAEEKVEDARLEIEEEKIYTTTFTARATRQKLIALKQFMDEVGIDYE